MVSVMKMGTVVDMAVMLEMVRFLMDSVSIVDCCLDGLSDNSGDDSCDDLGDGSGDLLGDDSDVGDGIDDVDGEDGINGGGGELREAFTRIKIMELKEEVGGSFTGRQWCK